MQQMFSIPVRISRLVDQFPQSCDLKTKKSQCEGSIIPVLTSASNLSLAPRSSSSSVRSDLTCSWNSV